MSLKPRSRPWKNRWKLWKPIFQRRAPPAQAKARAAAPGRLSVRAAGPLRPVVLLRLLLKHRAKRFTLPGQAPSITGTAASTSGSPRLPSACLTPRREDIPLAPDVFNPFPRGIVLRHDPTFLFFTSPVRRGKMNHRDRAIPKHKREGFCHAKAVFLIGRL